MRYLGLILTAGLLAAGCGGESDPGPTAGCRDAADGSVTVVALDLAWDTDCLRAPSGALTVVIDNRDDGVNHNLHLRDAPDSPATELEAGPVRQELAVTLEAGEYTFVCDIHPNMVGTLQVDDANPSQP